MSFPTAKRLKLKRLLVTLAAMILAAVIAASSPASADGLYGNPDGTSGCSLAGSTWTCAGGRIGTLTLTGNQIITARPGTPGQFLTLRITQDATGGRVPTFDTGAFRFQNSSSDNTIVPIGSPNTTENLLFQWDDSILRWIFLSRSGVQQLAPGVQGGGNSIGPHLGNGGSVAALALPANTWTQINSDNGGYFASQGLGVFRYTQLVDASIWVCNYDTVTTLATFYCASGIQPVGFIGPVTQPVQIPAGQCHLFEYNNFQSVGAAANAFFLGYSCLVNPGNSVASKVTWNSTYNEQIPAD